MKNILKILSFLIFCTFYTETSDKQKQPDQQYYPITIFQGIHPISEKVVLCFTFCTGDFQNPQKNTLTTTTTFKEQYSPEEANKIIKETAFHPDYQQAIFTALTTKRDKSFQIQTDNK